MRAHHGSRPVPDALVEACDPGDSHVGLVLDITTRARRPAVQRTRLPRSEPQELADVGPWMEGFEGLDEGVTTGTDAASALRDAEHHLAVALPGLADAIERGDQAAMRAHRVDVLQQFTRVMEVLCDDRG